MPSSATRPRTPTANNSPRPDSAGAGAGATAQRTALASMVQVSKAYMHSRFCSGGAMAMLNCPFAFAGPLPINVSGAVQGGVLGVTPPPPILQI